MDEPTPTPAPAANGAPAEEEAMISVDEMDADQFQNFVDMAMSDAYDLVRSWSKKKRPDEDDVKLRAEEQARIAAASAEFEALAARPPRLGVGATPSTNSSVSKDTLTLRNKLAGTKRKTADTEADELTLSIGGKRKDSITTATRRAEEEDEDDDEDGESKLRAVFKRPKLSFPPAGTSLLPFDAAIDASANAKKKKKKKKKKAVAEGTDSVVAGEEGDGGGEAGLVIEPKPAEDEKVFNGSKDDGDDDDIDGEEWNGLGLDATDAASPTPSDAPSIEPSTAVVNGADPSPSTPPRLRSPFAPTTSKRSQSPIKSPLIDRIQPLPSAANGTSRPPPQNSPSRSIAGDDNDDDGEDMDPADVAMLSPGKKRRRRRGKKNRGAPPPEGA